MAGFWMSRVHSAPEIAHTSPAVTIMWSSPVSARPEGYLSEMDASAMLYDQKTSERGPSPRAVTAVWQRDLFWLLLAAGTIFLTNLGGAALWDLDEALYASCARDMMERGDWVVPVLAPPYDSDKPPLMFWMMMAGFATLGTTELAARIGAALCGIATVALVYYLGRRLFSRDAGFWAAMATASSIIFTVSARAATVDAALTLLSTLAIGLFALRTLAPRSSEPRPLADYFTWIAIWTAMGIAVLAKGPVGLLLPAAAIGLYLMIINHQTSAATSTATTHKAAVNDSGTVRTLGLRITAHLRALARFASPANFLRSLWQMRPMTGVLVVLVVAGPWFVLVGWRTDGEWLREFFMKANVNAFAGGARQGHDGPIWYYLPAVLIGFFPWSVFLGPTLAEAGRRIRCGRPTARACTLMLCWIGVWLVFWSLSSTKLPHYVLPAFPALALLTGMFLDGWIRRGIARGRGATRSSPRAAWWVHSSGATMVVVGLGALIALPIVAGIFVPGEWLLALVGPIVIAGGALYWRLAAGNRRRAALQVFTITAVAMLTFAFAFGAARVSRYRNATWLAATIQAHGDDYRHVIAYRFYRQSFGYYLGGSPQRCDQPDEVARFLGRRPGGYVVALDEDAEHLRQALGDRLIEVASQPRFLDEGQLVVLADRAWFTAERRSHRMTPR